MPGFNDIDHIKGLIAKYLRNELTESEDAGLQEWIGSSADNKAKFEELTNPDLLLQKMNPLQQLGQGSEATWQKIDNRFIADRRKIMVRRMQFAIAASIILVAGILTFSLMMRERPAKKTSPQVATTNASKNDVAPGGFKAKLTLADGSTVILNETANGEVTKQGSIAVINKDGGLIYAGKEKQSDKGPVFNTLSTARGETYSLMLSDGSRVWLNSESSIRYPVVFNGVSREVEVTGEAYFEVAHDAAKPFHALVNGMDVQVLGTKFNINAYSDEAKMKTTLLEGSVRVQLATSNKQLTNKQEAKLVPGQQAQVSSSGELKVVNDVDVDQVVAWKNGYFQFNGQDLKMVMKQLARWYDVQVVYEGNVPERHFGGKIPRNENVSVVLNALETIEVKFRIEGKKIIVTP